MDLKENNIKMSELLANREAKAIIKKQFPQFSSPLMLQMSKGMTLKEVLKLASSRVPAEQVERVLTELRAL